MWGRPPCGYGVGFCFGYWWCRVLLRLLVWWWMLGWAHSPGCSAALQLIAVLQYAAAGGSAAPCVPCTAAAAAAAGGAVGALAGSSCGWWACRTACCAEEMLLGGLVCWRGQGGLSWAIRVGLCLSVCWLVDELGGAAVGCCGVVGTFGAAAVCTRANLHAVRLQQLHGLVCDRFLPEGGLAREWMYMLRHHHRHRLYGCSGCKWCVW
jgi:hypothetical protein